MGRNSLNCFCFDQNLANHLSICEGLVADVSSSHHGRLSFARFQLLCLPAPRLGTGMASRMSSAPSEKNKGGGKLRGGENIPESHSPKTVLDPHL